MRKRETRKNYVYKTLEMKDEDPFLFDSGDGQIAGVDSSDNIVFPSTTPTDPSTLTSKPTGGANPAQHASTTPQHDEQNDGGSAPESCDQIISRNNAHVALKVGELQSKISELENSCYRDKQAQISSINDTINEINEKNKPTPSDSFQIDCPDIRDDIDELVSDALTNFDDFIVEACCSVDDPQVQQIIEANDIKEKITKELNSRIQKWFDAQKIDPIPVQDLLELGLQQQIADILESPESNPYIDYSQQAPCTKSARETAVAFETFMMTLIDVMDLKFILFLLTLLGRDVGEVPLGGTSGNIDLNDIDLTSIGIDIGIAAFGLLSTSLDLSLIFADIADELFDQFYGILGPNPDFEARKQEFLKSLLSSDVLPPDLRFKFRTNMNRAIQKEFTKSLELYQNGTLTYSEFLDQMQNAITEIAADAFEVLKAEITIYAHEVTRELFLDNYPGNSEEVHAILDAYQEDPSQFDHILNPPAPGSQEQLDQEDRLQLRYDLPDWVIQILRFLNLIELDEVSQTGGVTAFDFEVRNALPVAHESADCIGEQCSLTPRLRYRVRVIQPGRSLNNYHYAPEMLAQSATLLEDVPVQAYGYGQYQPMFSHLPQDVELMQPSGFALNRVGVLTDAAYENHPQFGEGLYATLMVDKAAESWARAILDEATTPGGNGTGVSIFADIDGDYDYDPLSDDFFVNVQAIKRFRSVDLASSPAAGGAIVAALEDACLGERERLASLQWWIKHLPAEEIMAARNWRTW